MTSGGHLNNLLQARCTQKLYHVAQGLFQLSSLKSSRVEVAQLFCIAHLSHECVLPLHLTRVSLPQLWRLLQLPIENISPDATLAVTPSCYSKAC